MRVIGIDFTSSPSRRKPITAAHAELTDDRLVLERIESMPSFEAFEALLHTPGPWIAGLDFPFGQSRQFLTGIGWPMDWSEYVGLVGQMDLPAFCAALDAYKAPREPGDKEHRRYTDVRAGSISPQKLYGVPVGKMFFAGAPRLLRAPGNIVPVRRTGDSRIIVEAYPALVARRAVGRSGYKSDNRRKQTLLHEQMRRQILTGLLSGECKTAYGCSVVVRAADAESVVSDPTADRLDALLCAVQAAWAWQRPDAGYGVPRDVDVLEGWICDPGIT